MGSAFDDALNKVDDEDRRREAWAAYLAKYPPTAERAHILDALPGTRFEDALDTARRLGFRTFTCDDRIYVLDEHGEPSVVDDA